MNLAEYLNSPGAMSAHALALAIELKGPAGAQQVLQWKRHHEGRRPSPENCVRIERATDGKVRRWDTRPDDWHLIWPELVGAPGAPRLPRAKHTTRPRPARTAAPAA